MILATLAVASSTTADERLSIADFAGTYTSSIHGGCSLTLLKDARFILTCALRQHSDGVEPRR